MKSKSRISKTEVLKNRIEELELALLTEKGKAMSDSINMGNFQRKAQAEIARMKQAVATERARSECFAFAFGYFKCRELLWLASQWMRNANFNLKINGRNYDRKAVLAEIEKHLSNMMTERK